MLLFFTRPDGPDFCLGVAEETPDLAIRLPEFDLLRARRLHRGGLTSICCESTSGAAPKPLCGTLHLLDLLRVLRLRPAPLLRGVARQLHPIDGEHLLADEPASSHTSSTSRNICAIGSAEPEMKSAIVVKWGCVSAESAHKKYVLAAPASRSRRLEVMPFEYANSTILRSIAGS